MSDAGGNSQFGRGDAEVTGRDHHRQKNHHRTQPNSAIRIRKPQITHMESAAFKNSHYAKRNKPRRTLTRRSPRLGGQNGLVTRTTRTFDGRPHTQATPNG